MSPSSKTVIAPALILSSVVVLGTVMCLREPETAPMFVLAMLFLPVAWAAIEWRGRRKPMTDRRREDLASTRYWITLAGLLVAAPLALTVVYTTGSTPLASDAVEQRSMGVMVGVLMLIVGNIMPKRPVSLSGDECSPAAQQSLMRGNGLVMLVTGLAYALVWGFAPLDIALPVSMAVIGLGCGFMILRSALRLARR